MRHAKSNLLRSGPTPCSTMAYIRTHSRHMATPRLALTACVFCSGLTQAYDLPVLHAVPPGRGGRSGLRAGFEGASDHEPGSRPPQTPRHSGRIPDMLTQYTLPPWLTIDRLLIAVVILAALVIVQRIRRTARRRRPARLHPKLQKYGGTTPEQQHADLEASRRIIATSSTGAVAGYRIVQQIEAVFVDGSRAPDDAIAALKAAAGRRGANAIINLSQQRTAAGRCTAQGDAVIIRPTAEP